MKKNEIITRQFTGRIEMRADEAGTSRRVGGYAIVFNEPSAIMDINRGKEVREVIAPEAVTEDLLNRSDIKFTMFHDGDVILARRDKGEGSLSCEIDERGVAFEFEMPNSMYGDYALDAIKRRDIKGCSFAFTTSYNSSECVERSEDETAITYTVRKIFGLYDMTLTPDPAYPATSVALRDIVASAEAGKQEEINNQIAEMRKAITDY